MHHILGNKVLEYDVDDRGVIVDEREIDRTVNPKPNIADWVKEHMVFWYDMSKPVDTYIPGIVCANPFVNGGGKLTYDNAINKCIITHTPTNNDNIAFWQIIVKPLQYVESYKIRVTGLPEGFTMKGRLGYVSIQITSDGEYDIPEYKNSSTTNSSYPGFYLAGDNVNDVDCNIVVEEIPTKQSVPTNEILKTNPYLQDFSGNNRPLKLNNFLFAAMSGVGGKEVYPNALVTDGVDDYGVVENFKSLQNYMMFFQCAIIRPATSKGMFSTTPIEGNIKGWMLLQGNSANEVRFGNNVYKNFNVTSSIGDKISYVLSANNELMTCYVGEEKATIAGTYKQTGANMSLFLSDNNNKTRFGSMAFYKSILFDSVPTKQNDGFTEQDLIDYVLENLITK